MKNTFFHVAKFVFISIGVVVVLFFIVAIAFSAYFKINFSDKVLPNTYFDDILVSQKNIGEIESLVADKKKKLSEKIILSYGENEIEVKITDIGFLWDDKGTVEKIINYGREENFVKNFIVQVKSLIYKNNVDFSYSIDNFKIQRYLKELAAIIDKDPVDGKLEMKNGKAVIFNISSDGQKLLIEKNIKLIENSIAHNDKKIELTIDLLEAKNSNREIDSMGVKELVATGESSFAGSPPNRIHNINTGAKIFDGVIIPPGENFSFMQTLGEVSAKTGFLPELVIKEDKTIPEYGGGLCQVSTTFFRAAINAGLPIVERTAHAYRVTYYEPAGFDSTIYDPKPDLVFKNDTGKYILVETRIIGNNLFVDFYGTKDGRRVAVSSPIIYNYVQPGEPIRIETTELEPGVEKQTDTAHIGADAYFTRTIEHTNGEKVKERFDSHYVPWRAKFLVGKSKDLGQPTDEEKAESF
ncbi:VanW family protein [Candidatus Microgenomates bacterium]|nr:VanW family protein [Candidatus Microgenomates bacterium]